MIKERNWLIYNNILSTLFLNERLIIFLRGQIDLLVLRAGQQESSSNELQYLSFGWGVLIPLSLIQYPERQKVKIEAITPTTKHYLLGGF